MIGSIGPDCTGDDSLEQRKGFPIERKEYCSAATNASAWPPSPSIPESAKAAACAKRMHQRVLTVAI